MATRKHLAKNAPVGSQKIYKYSLMTEEELRREVEGQALTEDELDYESQMVLIDEAPAGYPTRRTGNKMRIRRGEEPSAFTIRLYNEDDGELRGPCVYFIVNEDMTHVKIGRASDISKRLPGLQTGSFQKLQLFAYVENGGPVVEAFLHRRYAELSVHGEWFRLETYILDDIANTIPLSIEPGYGAT